LLRFRPAAADHPAPFDTDVLARFDQHTWPGNVRELANVIEHASVMCDQLPIRCEHLPSQLGQTAATGNPRNSAPGAVVRDGEETLRGHWPDSLPRQPVAGGQPTVGGPGDSAHLPAAEASPIGLTLREMEQRMIEAALERHHGNKTAAAQELGVSIKTLYNKLNASSDRAAA
jgi:two-component system NtrC family response regulator